jgi:hypothetical protein
MPVMVATEMLTVAAEGHIAVGIVGSRSLLRRTARTVRWCSKSVPVVGFGVMAAGAVGHTSINPFSSNRIWRLTTSISSKLSSSISCSLPH